MPRKKVVTDDYEEVGKPIDLETLKEQILTETIEKLNAEEPIVHIVTTESVPKRYIANLYWELEPLAKDIFCGSYVYWESTNTITWEALNPSYSTDLEDLSKGDYQCEKEGRKYLISRWETPKEWLVNLPFAILGSRYICKNVVELYETE